MKNTKQNTVLMGITAVCVVASLFLCGFSLRFNKVIRAAQEMQVPAREMQRVQIERNLLRNDLQEYARTHPDLERFLNQSAAAAKPTVK